MSSRIYHEFLVVYKKSRWEVDLAKHTSEKELKEIYDRQNNVGTFIYDSHLRQQKNIQTIMNALPGATFITLDKLAPIDTSRFRYCIVLGGDNHFVHTAHQITNKLHLRFFSVNSDPLTSTGALLYFTVDSFIKMITSSNEAFDNLQFESWSSVSGILTSNSSSENITPIENAISEVSIHSTNGDTICRLLIRKNTEPWEDVKGTGLLIATGVGSSGWYSNCFCDSKDHSFAKDVSYFRSILREPPFIKRENIRNLNLKIQSSDCLEVISRVEATVVVDSYPQYSYAFPPGAHLKFMMSNQKMVVICNSTYSTTKMK